MPVCFLVYPCGECVEVVWDHEEAASHMGGPITFVGAIPDLQIFALARRCNEEEDLNPFCKNPQIYMQAVKGCVLFVATDELGDPIDVNVEMLKNRLGEDILSGPLSNKECQS